MSPFSNIPFENALQRLSENALVWVGGMPLIDIDGKFRIIIHHRQPMTIEKPESQLLCYHSQVFELTIRTNTCYFILNLNRGFFKALLKFDYVVV